MEEKTRRLGELDGLRALSILLVVAGHLLPLGPKVLEINAAVATAGMSIFFSLSGFLIASTLFRNPDVFDFLVRRGARILPLFYAYILVVFILLDGNIQALLWSSIFAINYETQYLSHSRGHLWSLCVEIHFYLAIAGAVALFGRKAIWLVWPTALAVMSLRVNAGSFISLNTHLRVDDILAGAAVATLHSRESWQARRFGVLMIPVGLGLLFLTCWPLAGPLQYARPWVSALLLAFTIWSIDGPILFCLRSTAARYIAEISYALYIVHPLTAYGWMNEGSASVRYLVKRPISFLLMFGLAHASTFYWEKPWRQWASRYLSRRRQFTLK